MSYDGKDRRSSDESQENMEIILTRIDERGRNLVKLLDDHIKRFDLHVEEDKRSFGGLYKTAYIGTGVVITIQFVILLFKH